MRLLHCYRWVDIPLIYFWVGIGCWWRCTRRSRMSVSCWMWVLDQEITASTNYGSLSIWTLTSAVRVAKLQFTKARTGITWWTRWVCIFIGQRSFSYSGELNFCVKQSLLKILNIRWVVSLINRQSPCLGILVFWWVTKTCLLFPFRVHHPQAWCFLCISVQVLPVIRNRYLANHIRERYIALQNNKLGQGPLASYFKGEVLHGRDTDIFTSNMCMSLPHNSLITWYWSLTLQISLKM